MAEKRRVYVRKQELTEEENQLFHINYQYMWQELGVTPYSVKSRNTKDSEVRTVKGKVIQGIDSLPSYGSCYACFREHEKPSLHIVHKIVAFYNANLEPMVSVHQFLNEDLSAHTTVRHRGTNQYDKWFIGTFDCYYVSSNKRTNTAGAILYMYQKDNVLKARMVTGIHSDEHFQSKELRKLLRKPALERKEMQRLLDKIKPEGKSYYYYEGNAELSDTSLLMVLRDLKGDSTRKLIFNLQMKRFSSDKIDPYYGGIGLAMTTADPPFGARSYPMGILNSKYGQYSLQDEDIWEALRLPDDGRGVVKWNETNGDGWFDLFDRRRAQQGG